MAGINHYDQVTTSFSVSQTYALLLGIFAARGARTAIANDCLEARVGSHLAFRLKRGRLTPTSELPVAVTVTVSPAGRELSFVSPSPTTCRAPSSRACGRNTSRRTSNSPMR